MNARLRKALGRVAWIVTITVVFVAFLGFRARRLCDQTIGVEVAPPPYLCMRFALRPDHYMEGVNSGFKPGWVVTYAPPSKTYGTAFYVSFLGKMEARGTPLIVTAQQREAQEGLEEFRQAFAQVDAAVQVGTKYSSVVAMLGEPVVAFTNDNKTIEVHFSYMPRDLERVGVDWLTNGLTLVVSNDVIVRKGLAYTSSR